MKKNLSLRTLLITSITFSSLTYGMPPKPQKDLNDYLLGPLSAFSQASTSPLDDSKSSQCDEDGAAPKVSKPEWDPSLPIFPPMPASSQSYTPIPTESESDSRAASTVPTEPDSPTLVHLSLDDEVNIEALVENYLENVVLSKIGVYEVQLEAAIIAEDTQAVKATVGQKVIKRSITCLKGWLKDSAQEDLYRELIGHMKPFLGDSSLLHNHTDPQIPTLVQQAISSVFLDLRHLFEKPKGWRWNIATLKVLSSIFNEIAMSSIEGMTQAMRRVGANIDRNFKETLALPKRRKRAEHLRELLRELRAPVPSGQQLDQGKTKELVTELMGVVQENGLWPQTISPERARKIINLLTCDEHLHLTMQGLSPFLTPDQVEADEQTLYQLTIYLASFMGVPKDEITSGEGGESRAIRGIINALIVTSADSEKWSDVIRGLIAMSSFKNTPEAEGLVSFLSQAGVALKAMSKQLNLLKNYDIDPNRDSVDTMIRLILTTHQKLHLLPPIGSVPSAAPVLAATSVSPTSVGVAFSSEAPVLTVVPQAIDAVGSSALPSGLVRIYHDQMFAVAGIEPPVPSHDAYEGPLNEEALFPLIRQAMDITHTWASTPPVKDSTRNLEALLEMAYKNAPVQSQGKVVLAHYFILDHLFKICFYEGWLSGPQVKEVAKNKPLTQKLFLWIQKTISAPCDPLKVTLDVYPKTGATTCYLKSEALKKAPLMLHLLSVGGVTIPGYPVERKNIMATLMVDIIPYARDRKILVVPSSSHEQSVHFSNVEHTIKSFFSQSDVFVSPHLQDPWSFYKFVEWGLDELVAALVNSAEIIDIDSRITEADVKEIQKNIREISADRVYLLIRTTVLTIMRRIYGRETKYESTLVDLMNVEIQNPLNRAIEPFIRDTIIKIREAIAKLKLPNESDLLKGLLSNLFDKIVSIIDLDLKIKGLLGDSGLKISLLERVGGMSSSAMEALKEKCRAAVQPKVDTPESLLGAAHREILELLSLIDPEFVSKYRDYLESVRRSETFDEAFYKWQLDTLWEFFCLFAKAEKLHEQQVLILFLFSVVKEKFQADLSKGDSPNVHSLGEMEAAADEVQAIVCIQRVQKFALMFQEACQLLLGVGDKSVVAINEISATVNSYLERQAVQATPHLMAVLQVMNFQRDGESLEQRLVGFLEKASAALSNEKHTQKDFHKHLGDLAKNINKLEESLQKRAGVIRGRAEDEPILNTARALNAALEKKDATGILEVAFEINTHEHRSKINTLTTLLVPQDSFNRHLIDRLMQANHDCNQQTQALLTLLSFSKYVGKIETTQTVKGLIALLKEAESLNITTEADAVTRFLHSFPEAAIQPSNETLGEKIQALQTALLREQDRRDVENAVLAKQEEERKRKEQHERDKQAHLEKKRLKEEARQKALLEKERLEEEARQKKADSVGGQKKEPVKQMPKTPPSNVGIVYNVGQSPKKVPAHQVSAASKAIALASRPNAVKLHPQQRGMQARSRATASQSAPEASREGLELQAAIIASIQIQPGDSELPPAMLTPVKMQSAKSEPVDVLQVASPDNISSSTPSTTSLASSYEKSPPFSGKTHGVSDTQKMPVVPRQYDINAKEFVPSVDMGPVLAKIKSEDPVAAGHTHSMKVSSALKWPSHMVQVNPNNVDWTYVPTGEKPARTIVPSILNEDDIDFSPPFDSWIFDQSLLASEYRGVYAQALQTSHLRVILEGYIQVYNDSLSTKGQAAALDAIKVFLKKLKDEEDARILLFSISDAAQQDGVTGAHPPQDGPGSPSIGTQTLAPETDDPWANLWDPHNGDDHDAPGAGQLPGGLPMPTFYSPWFCDFLTK
jgi:hypothetical protein